METIAIDLGKDKSQVCIRDSKGKILQEKQCRTQSLGGYLRYSFTSPLRSVFAALLRSSAPTGGARSVLPVREEPRRGRKPDAEDAPETVASCVAAGT